jgi:hypothetical protein
VSKPPDLWLLSLVGYFYVTDSWSLEDFMSLINRVLTDALMTLSEAAYEATLEGGSEVDLSQFAAVIDELEALRQCHATSHDKQ